MPRIWGRGSAVVVDANTVFLCHGLALRTSSKFFTCSVLKSSLMNGDGMLAESGEMDH